MLILTRRPGEGVMIGDDIYIQVSLRDKKRHPRIVTLGIEAPRDVHIVREEVLKRDRVKHCRKDFPINRQNS